MPQNQQQRSDMWWRGHNDAIAGEPPDQSYYHYYYDYKLAYDKARREQRRTHRQRALAQFGRRLIFIGPAVLLVAGLAFGAWYLTRPEDNSQKVQAVAPTRTPRPTPRPTLALPTPTLEPILRADSFAVVTGTDGVPLRARSKPGTGDDAVPVTRFREGQSVRVLEGPATADGLEWWRIEADGESGWAAAPYLMPVDSTQ